jgi:hypothetical protein
MEVADLVDTKLIMQKLVLFSENQSFHDAVLCDVIPHRQIDVYECFQVITFIFRSEEVNQVRKMKVFY